MKFKKLCSLALSAFMALTLGSYTLSATETSDSDADKWDVSKSKSAERIDEDKWEVTLSLPSKEYVPTSDVVFVLDRSSSSVMTDVKAKANELLAQLASKTGEGKGTINVAVVNFDYEAHVDLELTELTEDSLETIQNAINSTTKSGTNLEAGILAGAKILDEDTDVPAENKYLVLVSDGITHSWNENHVAGGQTMTTYWKTNNDGTINSYDGTTPYLYFRGENKITSYESLISTMQNDPSVFTDEYDRPYGLKLDDLGEGDCIVSNDLTIQNAPFPNVYSQVELATYYAALAWQNLNDSYHTVSLYWEVNNEEYPLSVDLMKNVLGASSVEENIDQVFTELQNEIIYLLDSGSVTDVIGEDFVLDESVPFSVTVNGEEVDLSTKEDYAVSHSNGVITWNINVPVKKDEPVQLKYTVKLKDSAKAEAGSFTTPTNESAVLDYKDSNGNSGNEAFEKTQASYEIGILEVTHRYDESVGEKDQTLSLPEKFTSEPLIVDWTEKHFAKEDAANTVSYDGFEVEVNVTYPDTETVTMSIDEFNQLNENGLLAKAGVTSVEYVYTTVQSPVIDDNTPDDTDDTETNTPNTGDTLHMYLIAAACAMLILCAIAFLDFKKEFTN